MKNKLLLMFLPVLAATLCVGGGFAVFIYSDLSKVDNSQKVSIGIVDNPEIGKIELRYTDEGGDLKNELANSDFKNQVFMDFDSVYIIRNDNPTLERNFTISYKGPSTTTSNLNVTLFCEVTIEDSDERGVSVVEFADENGEERFYPSSKSVLDIYEPSVVLYENWDDNFTLISGGKENDNKATYRATVRNDLLADSSTSGEWHTTFNVNFNYKFYSTVSNGERIEGSMAPSLSESSASYKKKLASNKEACDNSKVSITFYLQAEEKV